MMMEEKPILKPNRSDRGWFLTLPEGDGVTDSDGFVVWFSSRKAAQDAASRVTWSPVNEWWQVA
jgi:hypothetical protein